MNAEESASTSWCYWFAPSTAHLRTARASRGDCPKTSPSVHAEEILRCDCVVDSDRAVADEFELADERGLTAHLRAHRWRCSRAARRSPASCRSSPGRSRRSRPGSLPLNRTYISVLFRGINPGFVSAAAG